MTRACPATRRAGKIARSVLRILVRAESVMFMAIAVALVVIAVVCSPVAGTISCWRRAASSSR